MKFSILNLFAAMLFLGGLIILIICIRSFALRGKGTLSPVDPPKKLVITGLYKFTRNPMYLGVTLSLIGECIFFASIPLLAYTICVFIVFNLFIMLYEELKLKTVFGIDYLDYKKNVGRWF